MYSKIQFDSKYKIGGGYPPYYTLDAQDNPQASLCIYQKLFEGMWLINVASKLLPYPAFYSNII